MGIQTSSDSPHGLFRDFCWEWMASHSFNEYIALLEGNLIHIVVGVDDGC